MTGIFAANIVGKTMVGIGERALKRIPVVRSVYSAAKNFSELVFSETGQSFKKVLLIEYPRQGIYSLAFQTSTALGEVQKKTGSDVVCTFVPTTPNPTSGYIIILPKEDVIEMDMSVDEAFKMIVSLGVVVPTWSEENLADLPIKSSLDDR